VTAVTGSTNSAVSTTPLAQVRAQAVANLRTSASTISSLSSGSQSTLSTSRVPSVCTRGQKAGSEEVDDSDSKDKDENELIEMPEDVLVGDRNLPTWEDDEEDEVSDLTDEPNEDNAQDDEDIGALI
jgi:hypothetical protein